MVNRNICLNCGKETNNIKFCSNLCYVNYCKKNGIGFWSFDVRSKAGKIGGKKAVEINKRNHTGLFGMSKEQRIKNGEKYGVLGGKVSWKKVDEICKKNKTGIYGISKEQRIKNGIKGGTNAQITLRKNKLGIYGISKKDRIKNGRLGAKAANIVNKKNKKSICYDYKLREQYPIPFKDTKIETKIQGFLEQLRIKYIKHKFIKKIKHKYNCDIFIPSMNLVIECDGDYWHGNPSKYVIPNKMQLEHIERDIIRTKELINNNFNILRLWGSEINKLNINGFKNKIDEIKRQQD